MRLVIVLVTLTIVAWAFAQDPQCVFNMAEKKCEAEEDFPDCRVVALQRTNCVCPQGTKCKLQENDGACEYSCETVGQQPDDNNAGSGPGVGQI